MCVLLPHFVFAETILGSDMTISTDTTWTTEGSPYIIQDVLDIADGATLYIEPGVEVGFSGGGYEEIYIDDGAIDAEGTSNAPITFTSVENLFADFPDLQSQGFYSDSWSLLVFDGLVNIQHANISGVSHGIDFFDGTSGTFDATNITDGGIQLFTASSLFATSTNISNVSNEALGVYEGSTASLADSSISSVSSISSFDDGDAVGVYGSSAMLSNIRISGVSGDAIQSFFAYGNRSSLSIASSTIQNVSRDAIYVQKTDVNIGGLTVDGATDGITSSDGANILIATSTIQNMTNAGLKLYGGDATITDSTITSVPYGIEDYGAPITITNSTLSSTTSYAILNTSNVPVSAQNNFWGDASGPYEETVNPDGLGGAIGDLVNGNITFSPWLTSDPTILCCSNVLFLPGIESSRLYSHEGSILPENQLWEPISDSDGEFLSLDQNGSSTPVYTKEGGIIDEAYPDIIGPFAPNFYKSFIAFMNDMKSDNTINDWEPIAYDWRLSLDQLINNGTDENGEISYLDATSSPYIIQELERLAGNSKTGKVTIIAHSNGGLVAKALMIRLHDLGLENLVDKIIFVAVPQTGTPAGISGLLHGGGQGISVFLSTKEARRLGDTLPGAYNLLPSSAYFDSVLDPVVTFSTTTALSWIQHDVATYGFAIGSSTLLDEFLEGDEGRSAPAFSDLASPTILSSRLISDSDVMHDALDNWTPPANIELIQIAGWGVDTVSGINYYQGVKNKQPALVYSPTLVEDGDGTVVVPSALATATSTPNIERYWLNLGSYNSEEQKILSLRVLSRTHADILEVPELRDFIQDIIKGPIATLPNYISTSSPISDNQNKRLRFILHSDDPVSLDLYDSDGNHTGISTTTGLLETNIPNTYYNQFGNVTYVSVPASSISSPQTSGEPQNGQGNPPSSSSPIHMVVTSGGTSGSFTLDVEETDEENVISTTTSFVDVPLFSSTTVSMDVPDEISTTSLPVLDVDQNGNGANNFELTPSDTSETSVEELNNEVPTVVSEIIPTIEKQSVSENRSGGSHTVAVIPPTLPEVQNQNPIVARVQSQPVQTPIVSTVVAPQKQNITHTTQTKPPKTDIPENNQAASVYDAMSGLMSSIGGAFNFVADIIGGVFTSIFDFLKDLV